MKTLKDYENAVRKLVDFSALDMSAEELDRSLALCFEQGVSPRQCALELSDCLQEEMPDRFMRGAHY